jgi:hypothetical protein
MDKHESPVDREMLIAEFAALRAEILQRSSLQWKIVALQLTAAGVIVSFALSSPSHTGFLLILPLISYALIARYISHFLVIQALGTYIHDVLEVRAKGELHWQTWYRAQPLSRHRILNWLNANFLVFPGTSVIALAWEAPYVWESHTSAGKRVLIIIIWLIGVAVTVLSIQMISSRLSSFGGLWWRQKSNQLPGIQQGLE